MHVCNSLFVLRMSIATMPERILFDTPCFEWQHGKKSYLPMIYFDFYEFHSLPTGNIMFINYLSFGIPLSFINQYIYTCFHCPNKYNIIL